MIEHLLHRYEQEIVSVAERWEYLDTAAERAFLRGAQIGTLFLEQRVREAIEAAKGREDLAPELEDLVADLTRQVTYEKQAIAEADDIHTKLGFITALERGIQEIQAVAEEERRVGRDVVVRHRYSLSGGINPLRPLDDAL